MHILMTGGTGMLGKALFNALCKDHPLVYPTHAQMDVTQWEVVHEVLTNTLRYRQPEVVFHTAAMTDVNGCTKNPEEAYRQNALGTANIARACQEIGARLVYISTDYVFDGTNHDSYNEWDETNPINVYGQTKRAGEILAKENCSNVIVARTQWLYGDGSCFPNTILAKLQKGETVKVIPGFYGAPTHTEDLARVLAKATNPAWPNGTYHITAEGETSWMEVARFIANSLGLPPGRVEPFRGHWDDTPRPCSTVLDNQMLRMLGQELIPHWSTSLKSYLKKNKVPASDTI